jgi:2-oxoglutarate dehydrogenase E2 component (dihydrolipoamide succinyltransferase)
MATITMPSLGESVAEGEVGKWLVTEGQRVDKDQPLVEIMTDKADSEIPATEGGVVVKIFAVEGSTVAVGDRLCEIDPAAEATAGPSNGGSAKAPAPAAEVASAARDEVEAPTSPAVRKLAREKGVDLASVPGTGDGGRITRDDVLRAAASESGAPSSPPRSALSPPKAPEAPRAVAPRAPAGGTTGAFKLPPYVPTEGDEVVPYTRRRRIIADHMVFSKLTSPHVVTFAECDLHLTAKLREAHKNDLKKVGINLTFMAFVAAATCRALQEFRELNARVLDDAYVLLRDINLGIAVETPEGLVVPVLRNADELSIRGLARGIEDLAERARDGKLAPDDLANKTFTISNPGRKGNLVGGAIISQPNVGILRIGEIKKRVVVVEKDGEDFMAIHPVMHMALSYDHRIVDGVHANGFLWRINELLETGDFEV